MRYFTSTSFSSVLKAIVLTGSVGASVVFSGCQPQKSAPTPEQRRAAEPFLSHVVQFQGETLSIIAGWYTGSAKNWELLREANPGLNPNKIRLGDTIQIPRELVTREDPLPRSALPGGQKKGTSAAQPSSPSERSTRPQDEQRGVTDAPVVERDMSDNSRDAVSGAAEQAQAEADRAAEQASDAAASDMSAASADDSSTGEPATSGDEVSPDDSTRDSGSSAATEPAPTQPETKPEMRIKSRDELLKELLEE